MIDVAGLVLLRPLWLLAIPAVALLALLAARRRARAGWRQILDARLQPQLEALGYLRRGSRDGRIPALAAAASLAALGLAGPATRDPAVPALRNLDTVVLAVDLSRSMTEGGALDAVRAAAARVLADAGGRPVALVVFAGDAYLASPPTDDPRQLETLVAVLDADTMPDVGSRPGRALDLAAGLFAGTTERRRRDVVLISDGGGVGPEALHSAGLIADDGGRVSAIFVPPSAAPYGMPAPRRAALADLAAAGGGVLVDARRPAALTDALASRPADSVRREVAALTHHDHGRALLVLALGPALLVLRRRR